MPQLQYNSGKLSFDHLLQDIPEALPANARAAALLVRQWIQGAERFQLHTSGTTGAPKAIWLERNKIVYSARLTAETFGLLPGDTLLCCLGVNYIAGFMMVMRALVNECDLVVTDPAANPMSEIGEEVKVDFASFVPLQMKEMLENGGENVRRLLNGMKAILVGGGPVSASLERKMQLIEAPIYHTYAMTETYTHVAVRLLNGPAASERYQPLKDVKTGVDGRGCLTVSSPLTGGETLITNDLVELDAEGSFKWLGRYDLVVNSGGVKVQIEKVESIVADALVSMGREVPFFAAGVPDERLGEKLILVLEGEAWQPEEQEKLLSATKLKLGKYEIPREIYFTPEILRTATGKIDRKATLRWLNILL